ncbi:hypothetical protein D3C84_1305760 [compost metagenome]
MKYPDSTVIHHTPFVTDTYNWYPAEYCEYTYMSQGYKITGLVAKPIGVGPFPLVLVNHGSNSHAQDHMT